MSESERRIFLVKPGDCLIFGNVGEIRPEAAQQLTALLKVRFGVRDVVFFSGDIDMAAVPSDGPGA